MMIEHENPNGHERFKELGALANSGTLSADERTELNGHLQKCGECREIYHQYRLLAREGVPMLAARHTHPPEHASWDSTATRERLFARVRAEQRGPFELNKSQANVRPGFLWSMLRFAPARAALAACLVLAVALGAYRLGGRTSAGAKQAQASAEDRYQKLVAERKSADELLDSQTKRLAQLAQQSSQRELEVTKLRSALQALEDREQELMAVKSSTEQRANELETANNATQDQLRTVSQQRDALSGLLRDAEKAYLSDQAEVASLRSQREKAVQQIASLESKIGELSAANLDLGRRARDDEQYLVSDRDIRELMGARKLYIADVFDVDGQSRTRKPFGRVFYTHGKSLIFYAFDLDHQPGAKNGSAFQAWGRNESGESKPVNLGILYMDNEANRRWVLRCDDPEELAQIDAVFVTVEPHGGSQKPSGKPFLYALLRKESNHP